MEEINKLYLVTLRGLSSVTSVQHKESYVIAKNSHEAYMKIRNWLDAKDYGFGHERELDNVKLIAEAYEYTGVRTMLFE
jgi:hypothetical protein